LSNIGFFISLPILFLQNGKKHQDESILLKFVKEDNFDVGILITIVECCEC